MILHWNQPVHFWILHEICVDSSEIQMSGLADNPNLIIGTLDRIYSKATAIKKPSSEIPIINASPLKRKVLLTSRQVHMINGNSPSNILCQNRILTLGSLVLFLEMFHYQTRYRNIISALIMFGQ